MHFYAMKKRELKPKVAIKLLYNKIVLTERIKNLNQQLKDINQALKGV